MSVPPPLTVGLPAGYPPRPIKPFPNGPFASEYGGTPQIATDSWKQYMYFLQSRRSWKRICADHIAELETWVQRNKGTPGMSEWIAVAEQTIAQGFCD
jgi:hypothetical protein